MVLVMVLLMVMLTPLHLNNATNQTFHLRNPWGSTHADVTWSQLLSLSAIIQWSNT